MDKLQRFKRYSKRMFGRLNKREEECAVDWHFTTYINEEERLIVWCVENISCCPLKTGECHQSPSFSTGFSSEVKWVIKLYPKGRKVSEKVALFICKISEKPRTDINYRLEVKLIPETTEVLEEQYEIYSCKNPSKSLAASDKKVESNEWGTDELIPSKHLLGKKSIRIMCYLSVVYVEGGNVENCISGPWISSTLHDDLKKMYTSGKFSDVTLQVGKKHFLAHKAVLAARSKFLSDMFDQLPREAPTNVVTIVDIEPVIMSNLLQYIYTGKVEDLTWEKAISLFSAADKFSLQELQKHCVTVMLAKLSIENVCRIAILAETYSVSKLKIATNYFFWKYKHEILQKKEWKDIIRDKPQLASNILQAVSSEFNTTF